MKTYLVTLNWNTTDYLKKLAESIRENTQTDLTWIIVDNGSDGANASALYEWAGEFFREIYVVYAGLSGIEITMAEEPRRLSDTKCVIIRSNKNLGCIKGHNLAFDAADILSARGPHQIVMVDTDVEVLQYGWLEEVRGWANRKPSIGIVGLEHSRGEACAGAIFLDTSGNWYIHPGQTFDATPVEGESVGLGLALIKWRVLREGLRFDTGFDMYYKQDDDLAFSVRAIGFEVWAYPIECVHWGSGSLKENEYKVGVASGRPEFESGTKRKNQAYFAKKWAWALRGRRGSLSQETAHLKEMKALMRERRAT